MNQIKSQFKHLENNTYEVSIYPLQTGFGNTFGNSLRRILISSIKGYALSKVKINDLTHEYRAIEGVVEDVQNVLLNLKGLIIKVDTDVEEVELNLNLKKKGDVTAANFEKQAGVTVINPDMYICSINGDTNLNIRATITRGVGFSIVDDLTLSNSASLSDLYVDSFYSPVRNVMLNVDNVRVGDKTNLDKMVVTFTTNGSVVAKEVFNEALSIAIEQYTSMLTAFESINPQEDISLEHPAFHNPEKIELTEDSVEAIGLTKTTTKQLIGAGVITTKDIVKYKDAVSELLKQLKSKSDKEILSKLVK